jgi:hypothetical protein
MTSIPELGHGSDAPFRAASALSSAAFAEPDQLWQTGPVVDRQTRSERVQMTGGSGENYDPTGPEKLERRSGQALDSNSANKLL